MILSARVHKTSRSRRYCSNCIREIKGVFVRLYGMIETGDKPYELISCPDCLQFTKDSKVKHAYNAAKLLEERPDMKIKTAMYVFGYK